MLTTASLEPPELAIRSRSLGTLIMAMTSSDAHVVANQLIAHMLRERGYDVINLGACTPISELMEAYARHRDALAIVIGSLNGHAREEAVAEQQARLSSLLAESAAPISTAEAVLARSAALQVLPERARAALWRLIRQRGNSTSRNARTALQTLVRRRFEERLTVAEQATWLRRLLTDTAILPAYAQVLAPVFPSSTGFTLSPPRLVERIGTPPPREPERFRAKLLAFVDTTRPFDRANLIIEEDFVVATERVAEFTATIAGQEIKITTPLLAGGAPPDPDMRWTLPADEPGGPPLVNHSVLDVARALARLPATHRRLLKQVDVFARRSAMDAVLGPLYGRADLRGYMTANHFPLNVIGIFPQTATNPGDPSTMQDTIAHEAGHVATYVTFGFDRSSPGWTGWISAMAEDDVSPSSYGRSSLIEDSAEAALLYGAVRSMGASGASLEGELAQLFPARWRILETLLP